MSKAEKLQNHLKSADEPKKWKAYVVVAVGVLVGVGLFFGGMAVLNPIIQEYIDDKPISHLYDFYDLKVGENQTAVYFLGNSQIGADVYIPLIQDELNQKGYGDISVYNIYRDSDNPIRRLSHIENIIESKPSLVIYGVSPWIFTSDTSYWVDEDVLLVKDRLNLNPNADYYYSDEELEDLYIESATPFYMKKFIKSAIGEKISSGGNQKITDAITYTTDTTWEPWNSDENRKRYSNTFGINGSDLIDYVELTDTYANTSRNIISLTPFTGEETRKLMAFEYILKRFSEENIPVVLVIMPDHSILKTHTPEYSYSNLREYVNNSGLHWYDLDSLYGDEIMADLTHVHWDGAVELAPVWADIVIKEMT